MDQTPTINILVVADLQTDAQRLISVLRKAGFGIHAQAVRSEESLRASLAHRRWDLLFLFTDTEKPEADRLQAALTQSGQDLPCIALGDTGMMDARHSSVPQQCILNGVTDLGDPRQCALLLRSVRRELDNLLARRELRHTRATLKELEQRYRLLFDSSSEAVAYLQDGLHIHVNPSYAALFGFQATADLQAVAFLDLVADEDVEAVRQYLRQPLRETPAGDHPPCVFHGRSADGLTRLSLDVAITPGASEHNLQIIVRAVSGNLAQQHRRHLLHSHDLSTGLHDRASLLSHIEAAIAQAIYKQQHSTLVLARLDAFANFAALAGRPEADRLLRDAAQLLQNTAPADAFIARCSDHEFALVLPRDRPAADALLPALEAALGECLRTRGYPPVALQLRAGIALINALCPDAGAVMAQAAHQLALTSRAGGSSRTTDAEHDTGQMLEHLQQAFDNDGFRLVFQPIVSLEQDGMERYEVRVRLHSRGRLVHPPQFLELAAQHGLGERLDQQVIRQCLQHLQTQRNPHLRLSITVSLSGVLSAGFLPWLVQQLRDAQLSVEQIALQFSELDVSTAPAQVALFCRQLRELQISLWITHFGCTLNPFKYLADLGASCVKLDHSLLENIDTSVQQRDQLCHIVNSLHASGVLVVAPMVEQIERLPLLWQCGVNFVQGHLLQEPGAEMDFSFVQNKEITLECFH